MRAFRCLDVKEDDDGLLFSKASYDRLADARRAAGDENDLAGEIRIDGGHDFLLLTFGPPYARPATSRHGFTARIVFVLCPVVTQDQSSPPSDAPENSMVAQP